jgi:NodT family efflux transporter outer membrane factor (OMF) lipoprotein
MGAIRQARSLILPAMTLLAGCVVGPDYHAPTVALTPNYLAAPSIDSHAANAGWWQAFHDPLLVTLIEQARIGNTDLEQARARVLRSRAAAKAVGAALLPVINGTGDVDRIGQSLDTAIGQVTTELGLPRDYSEYSVGGAASWELDFFGGLRRGREAAHAEAAASRADVAAMAISIDAETADAYLTLRTLQSRLEVTGKEEKNEALLVDLVRQRVGQGVSPDRDLNRASGALEGVRASMAPLRASIEAQLNRLDVLLGEQPGRNRSLLIEAAPIPDAPVPAGSAAPADLLRRRPDVIAAERRVAASNAQIGQAIAEYYPRISLSGLVGVASLTTGDLFTRDALQASGGAGLRWRLFDFGRIDAEVAAARGRRAEALAAWRGSVLSAAEDVETALARLAEAHRERASLGAQVAALTKAREQARQAYESGVTGLINVTDADRQLLAASDHLVQARGDEARQAVFAYRALGGGWQVDAAASAVAYVRDR